MEIIEKMFSEEEHEDIIDLAIEILDNHFGYDESFFCDSDGIPINDPEHDNMYNELMCSDDPIF